MARQKTKQPTAVAIARRQAILDHLNACPKQTMHQIAGALRASQRTISAYVREMRGTKEIGIAGHRRIDKATIPLYSALVRKTVHGDPRARTITTEQVLQVVTKEIRPGHIRHLGTQRDQPLKDAGGQGRLGGGWGVASTLGDSALSIAI